MFRVDKKTRSIQSDEGFEVLLDFKSIKYEDSDIKAIVYTEELVGPNVIEIFENTLGIYDNKPSSLVLGAEKKRLIIDRICKTLDFAGLRYKVTA